MRTWKLVSGILSVLIFIVIEIQSFTAGVINFFSGNGSISGTLGALCGILILVGGILSAIMRDTILRKKSDGILLILFGIATVLGFIGCGTNRGLVIWSVWALVNAALAFWDMFTSKY